jgi:hypothetical protein
MRLLLSYFPVFQHSSPNTIAVEIKPETNLKWELGKQTDFCFLVVWHLEKTAYGCILLSPVKETTGFLSPAGISKYIYNCGKLKTDHMFLGALNLSW